MDRRSWLWRRKSLEKSPGETESSVSMSSQSERFSDDQAYSNHSSQSPEVTSKAAPRHEEVNENVRTLTEKLSAALLNVSAKEDLVKQHAKVAEEAVSGWEKAENEILALKQQIEGLTLRNSTLEDRVGHLDGALKECLRQLRRAREEKEEKTHEAIDKKTRELQSTKSELEKQVVELFSQLKAVKTEASMSMDTDLRPKLETAEKENSTLKLELSSIAEELKLKITERDLSTKAAETASKQHLDSIKRVAKLEAECRRLKMAVRKASTTNDNRSVTASSVYVESFTDSLSDSGEALFIVESESHKISGLETNEFEPSRSSDLIAELDQFKNGKALGRNLMVPSVDINLMDDFLEMERLAALPESRMGSGPSLGALANQTHDGDIYLKAELEAMINRRSELQEILEKMKIEKVKLEITLTERQDQLNKTRNQLEDAESKVVEVETLLASANEAKKAAETERESTSAMLKTLKDRVEKAEIDLVEFQTRLDMAYVARRAVEVELEAADLKKEVAESRNVVVEAELKALLLRVGSLEEEVQKERDLSVELVAKCQKLEDGISRMQHEIESPKTVSLYGEMRRKQDMELALAESKFAECQKTIASLGWQLKSLATLDDFLIDTDNSLEVSQDGVLFPQDDVESWKSNSTLVSAESWINTRVNYINT